MTSLVVLTPKNDRPWAETRFMTEPFSVGIGPTVPAGGMNENKTKTGKQTVTKVL